MLYLDFLRRLHEVLDPPTYLEIGVRHGDSLALARSRSIGIDPAPELRVELPADVALFQETSDDFFARAEPLGPFGGRPAALAFIDGMHLVEFALRDFINVERHADWTSVVVFDDILPRTVEEAARERETRAWAGDLYKIPYILTRHRPDLICLRIGTQPTGLLLVLGLDPTNGVLRRRYDRIVRRAISPDPQPVPPEALQRQGVLEPEGVLTASFWSFLRAARERGLPRRHGLRDLRRSVRQELGLPRAPHVTRFLPALR